MRSITMLHGPYDDTGVLDVEAAVLVAPEYAMSYNDKHRQLWLNRVEPISDALDTYHYVDGISLTRQPVGFAELYALLRGMDAFTFITTYLFREVAEIEMFPPPDEATRPVAET